MGNIFQKLHDYIYPPRKSDIEVLLDQFEYRLALENFERDNNLGFFEKKENFR